MAYKTFLLVLIASLAAIGSATPLDITVKALLKRDLPQCPNGVVPPDDGPIKACLLPSFTCPSVGAQQKQLSDLNADPNFLAIATQENSGGNCGAGQLQIPNVGTKPGEGGSANCGFFNNNLAAINRWCPGATCDSLNDLGAAAKCQQLQIDGAGGFDKWAQYQRCGHPCGDQQGEA